MRKGIPVLLVEDDEVDVMTVQRAFARNGITAPLFVTRNGEEAIAFLRHQGDYADAPRFPRPGIILLDINMPVMSGTEFLEVVKADNDLRQIPVIVITTSREERDRLASFNLGVAGYIIKPVEFGKFVEAISLIDKYWTLTELPGASEE